MCMSESKEYVTKKCFDLVNPGVKGSRIPFTSCGGRKLFSYTYNLNMIRCILKSILYAAAEDLFLYIRITFNKK